MMTVNEALERLYEIYADGENGEVPLHVLDENGRPGLVTDIELVDGIVVIQ